MTNDTAAATDTKLASLTLTAAGSALVSLTPALFAAGTAPGAFAVKVTYTAFVPLTRRHETVTRRLW